MVFKFVSRGRLAFSKPFLRGKENPVEKEVVRKTDLICKKFL